MHSKIILSALLSGMSLVAIPMSTPAATPTDACQVLSAAQVSAAVGATVEAGTHVTPTFTKTCTWVVKNGGIIVTLNIQELTMFNGGKTVLGGTQATPTTGVGMRLTTLGRVPE